jgi:hypothetical protein
VSRGKLAKGEIQTEEQPYFATLNWDAPPSDDQKTPRIHLSASLIMLAQDSSRSVMLRERLWAKIYGEHLA